VSVGIYLYENTSLIQIIFHATFSEKVAQKGRNRRCEREQRELAHFAEPRGGEQS
jgi:hypothetical protein